MAGLGLARQGKAWFFQLEISMKAASAKVVNLNDATNGAEEDIAHGEPYTALVVVEGTADLLFHRWNCEAVEEKAKAAKNSKAKKEDNIESYVYRNEDGQLCLPGEYLRQSVIHAAKFRQDPRSPRKSAMDLFKAGVVAMTDLAPLGVSEWDYEHRARVQVQRNGVTRVRPAMRKGWRCEVALLVLVPEYIDSVLLRDVLQDAGRLVGVGDFRPTYGRFAAAQFEVVRDRAAA